MKVYALVLCAMMAFGAGASISAQQAAKPQATTGTTNAQALGNAQAVDETTLSLDAQTPATNQAAQAAGPDTFAYFLRMILVLALVVGAMYLVFTVMRRLAKPKESGDSPIRVLGSRALGPGKSVHLLGLGSKAWLVGASEHSLSLIAEIDDKELLDGLELDAATHKPPVSGDFAAILSSLLSRRKGGMKGAEPPVFGGVGKTGAGNEGSASFIARQRGRLDRFNGDQP